MVIIHSATVKVIKDGRITIPSDIRELEDIKVGDFLKITIEKLERPKKEQDKEQPKSAIYDTTLRQNHEAKPL